MVDRDPSSDSVIDLLDRVLDKGIVIDSSIRVSVAGIELLSVDVRIVVASIAVYLSYATPIREVALRSHAIATERRSRTTGNLSGFTRRAEDRLLTGESPRRVSAADRPRKKKRPRAN